MRSLFTEATRPETIDEYAVAIGGFDRFIGSFE
jgi:hypothetical protein